MFGHELSREEFEHDLSDTVWGGCWSVAYADVGWRIPLENRDSRTLTALGIKAGDQSLKSAGSKTLFAAQSSTAAIGGHCSSKAKLS